MTNKKTEWNVEQPDELLKYLLHQLNGRSRNAVKSILTRGQVQVNGKEQTKHNYPLKPGDRVAVNFGMKQDTSSLNGVSILYEDDHLFVIEKDAGLLTMASENEKQETAYRQLTDYVREQHPKNRIFIVHRLDRDTSGILLFAKSREVQQALQNNWQDAVNERTYVALVEGVVKKDGTIKSWLRETKTFLVVSSRTPNDGQLAITHYKVLKTNKSQSLLQVNLETGRKNQIRVHMKDIGHPVVGDKKYGAKTNTMRRLGLHALALSFVHPVTGTTMRFETKIPATFMKNFSSK